MTTGVDAALAESEALHGRVRAFARRHAEAPADPAEFDALAVEIARFQVAHVPGARRLLEAAGRPLTDAASIPAVPVVAFKMTRVAVHPAARDAVVFETSGTTASQTGRHAMRTTQTYRELSVAFGRRALVPDGRPRTVVALAPDPGAPPRSSLGAMMRAFHEEFDGRPGPTPFLASSNGVDVEALLAAAARAARREEPLLVLATGFALVLLLDALGGSRVAAPPGTVVMPTGGFKARTRELAPAELVAAVADVFSIPESHVVFEYGMTELTSQLYEGTLPGGRVRAPRGVYVPPAWLRVTAVDPESLAPLPPGETGIARFVDLGNVDSAVAIVTEDLVREREVAGAEGARGARGVELLGRRAGAEARGCSLAVEQMVLGAAPS